MDPVALLFAAGTIPYFTSRVIAPVFWLALWALAQENGVLEYIPTGFWIFEWRFSLDYPDWFIAPGTVLILFCLTVIEALAEKSPDAAQLMTAFDSEAKAFSGFIFNNAVTITSTFAIAASYGAVQAGFGFSSVLALIVGVVVWGFAKLRGSLVSFFLDADEEDDTGIRKLLSWAEDGWVGIGTFLLVILPALALIVSGLTLLGLVLVQRYLKSREEKQKVACGHCGEPNYAAATHCFSCREPMPAPVRLGFLGQPTRDPVRDAESQRLDLLSRKRCFVCAARLPRKALRQPCPACGTEVFPSVEWVDRYLLHVKEKLPRTLLVSLGLSLVPLLGLIPGIVYYRVSLISNLRRYIPRSTGCLLRWVVRLVNMVLLSLQWVPLLGALTLPLMCLVNYGIYQRSLENEKFARFVSHEGILGREASKAGSPLGPVGAGPVEYGR